MRDYFGERLGAEWAMFCEFSFPEFGWTKRDPRIHQGAAASSGSITSGPTCRGTKLVPLPAYFSYITLDDPALAQIV